MTNAAPNATGSAPPVAPAPAASAAARLLAFLGGLALAVVAVGLTFGVALAAFAGMAVAALLARRRGRPYTRTRGWLGAAAGAALAGVALMGWGASQAPSLNDPQVRAAMDSARVRQERRAAAEGPSAFERMMERAVPGSTAAGKAGQAETSRRLAESPVARWWTFGMGAAFFAGFLALYAGTLGWAAGTVLAFAATGRRPARGGDVPQRPVAADDPLAWTDAA